MPTIPRWSRRAWFGGAVAALAAVALAACQPVPDPPNPPAGGSGAVGQPAPGHSHSEAPPPDGGQIGDGATTPGGGGSTGPMPPGHMAGVAYDPTKLPTGFAGYGTDVLEKGGMPGPSGDGVGNFRTVCKYSHMAPDDPIVFPGQSGASHLHVFWGNSLTDANSTAQSIATTGNGTCRGGTINRTGYWAPAVIDTKTGTPIAPELIHVYYKSGYYGVRPNQINAMPPGLRMVAGDAKATAPQRSTHWECWNSGKQFKSITACPGDFVTMYIDFPQCWDGKNLDSPDHKSHTAYATDGRGCPADHPVAIPVITFNVLYKMPKNGDVSGWRLASDTYDPKMPAGYSIHGDWFDGWKPDIVNTWINGCVRKPVSCGSDMLGDGRSMGGDIG